MIKATDLVAELVLLGLPMMGLVYTVWVVHARRSARGSSTDYSSSSWSNGSSAFEPPSSDCSTDSDSSSSDCSGSSD